MKKMSSLFIKLKQHKLDNHFLYLIPVIIVTLGVIFSVRIFAEQSGGSPVSNENSRIADINTSLTTLGYGSTSAGTWGDWGSMWNRIRSAAEWAPTGTATAADVFPGKTFYANGTRSILTGSAVLGKYPEQANISYDDWIAAEGTANEYIAEEQTWTLTAQGGTAASVTDNSITQALSSNKVYKDALTKLYWSDKTVNTLDNEFIWTLGDNRVNPTGTSCNFNSTGTANAYCDNQDPTNAYTEDNDVSAAEFCLNLQLDGDNADGDNNGLTGVETDWRLPSQKELMQAYIDGSANNLLNAANNFWSSTENSLNRAYAWYFGLYNGTTNSSYKSGKYNARCVRGGQ